MSIPKDSNDPLMEAWYRLPGAVYFFKAGNAIKIGVTSVSKSQTFKEAIKRRHRQLQSANHETVVLLGAILFSEGDKPTLLASIRENELHSQFAASLRFKRYTVGSEWFTSSDQLLDFINENAQSPSDLDIDKIIASPLA
jgi:hypothetical protein